MRLRILLVVVSTAVDGWRGKIDDLKLRWPATIAAFFRPDEAVTTMKTTGVLLYSMWGTFLWWCGGLRRPNMGDRRREREMLWDSLRCGRVYGVPVPLKDVNRWILDETIGWLWLDRSAGFDPVWRGALKSRCTGWRGATGLNLGLFQWLRWVRIYLVFFKLFFF